MVYVFLSLAVLLFIGGMRVLGVVQRAGDVVLTAREALGTIQSPTLDDDEKELAIRQAAIRVFWAFWSLLARTAIILLLPVLSVLIVAQFGLFSIQDAIDASLNWYFIIGSTSLMVFALLVIGRR